MLERLLKGLKRLKPSWNNAHLSRTNPQSEVCGQNQPVKALRKPHQSIVRSLELQSSKFPLKPLITCFFVTLLQRGGFAFPKKTGLSLC